MPRAAASLLRVSTAAQAGADRYGLDVQRRAIKDYAAREGLELTGEFVDIESGVSEKRSSLYRLLSEAESFSAVIFFDLTRLARTERLAHEYLHLLSQAGLELHATNRGVVEAGLLTSIDMALSAEERRNIARRLRGGVIARADSGLPPNGIHLWGYRNVPKSLPEVDPAAAAHVRALYALGPDVDSWRAYSRAAATAGIPTPDGGTWAHNNIRRTITNPAYKGELIWPRRQSTTAKRTIVIPALVSAETWAAAQKPLGTPGRKPKGQTPLSGHVRCGVCGYGYSVHIEARSKTSPPRVYYRCNSRGRLEGRCRMPLVRAPDFEAAVELELRAALTDPDRLTRMIEEAEQARAPNPRLAELQSRERSFVEAFGKGDLTPDEFAVLRRSVRAELAAFARPDAEADYPLEEYRQAALTLSFAELVKFVSLVVVIVRDGFRLALEAPA